MNLKQNQLLMLLDILRISKLQIYCMVQPMKDNAPSFMLCTFAQPNFNYMACIKRINFIKAELAKERIEVLGWSSDGDPKLLKAMNKLTKMGNANNVPRIFANYINADLFHGIVCIQDECHICNKLKNRLFQKSNPVRMGYRCTANITHLISIVQQKLGSQANIKRSDVENVDKMSSNQALKISSDKVIATLRDNVPDSRGTELYLTLIKEQHEALFEKKLTPSERIFKMFFVVFILRAIRNERNNFKKTIKDFSASQFITLNAFKCIELNAVNLLKIARKLRDTKEQQHFLPWLMQSQTCESYFRLLRSITPNKSTVTNFSGLEGQFKMSRIQTMIDLAQILEERGCVVPSKHKDDISLKKEYFDIPNDESLAKTIQNAMVEAKKVLLCILRKSTNSDIVLSDFKFGALSYRENIKNTTQNNDLSEDPDIEDENQDEIDIPEDEIIEDPAAITDIDLVCQCQGLIIPESQNEPSQDENSRYFTLKDKDGLKYYIHKKTFVWLLSDKERLSSDRLSKYRTTSIKMNQLFRKENTPIQRLNEIVLLDFIILKGRIAQVIDFRKIGVQGRKTVGKITYKENVVPVIDNSDSDTENLMDTSDKESPSIGLLVNFFRLTKANEEYTLHLSKSNCSESYIDRKFYQYHIPRPQNDRGVKKYSLENGDAILKLLTLNE